MARKVVCFGVGLRRALDILAGKLVDEFGEALDGGFVTVGVEGVGGFPLAKGEQPLFDNGPRVDRGCHFVPADAVTHLLRHERPGRGVQPGVTGQRAIVEVDGAAGGLVQHRGVDDT